MEKKPQRQRQPKPSAKKLQLKKLVVRTNLRAGVDPARVRPKTIDIC